MDLLSRITGDMGHREKPFQVNMKSTLLLSLLAGAANLSAGVLTVDSANASGNPDIVGYNVGHFVAGSNTHDWWRYSGVNGARMFLSPSNIEPVDDIPGTGDGVTDQASFLSRRSALRADPLNTSFIDWPDFENRYQNELTGNSSSGNRFRTNYALTKLRELNISVLVQITASESSLPIASSSDWAGKWELWQHFYAQAFYLGRHFDVARYQMFNEPNHSNAGGLTTANWLMRLQLASDAIQTALADVNTRYGKTLVPLVYAPVNSGGNSYSSWGSVGVTNRHTNFLGVTDPNYLVMHRYDYHQYNDTPAQFATDLNNMKNSIAAAMAPETRFPMSISEFNVHTNGTFDTIPETLDTPAKYARLGAISAQLAKNLEKDLYCFKFAQTADNASTYKVAKNGMHYVHNGAEPYMYGGATRAAEVWRLFNKAYKPGGNQLKSTRDADGSLDNLEIRPCYDPSTGNYYIFSANEGSSAPITINTSAWNLPAGSPFLLEEVSDTRYGSGRVWGTVLADGTLSDGTTNVLTQASNTVWLFTIPRPAVETETILEATADATVTDGTSAGTNFGSTTTLLARNDPATADNRSAAFIRFDLPLIYPPDIQLAILSLSGKTSTASTTVQGHIYGINDDQWQENTITWNNAPNLLKGAAAGNLINNRVITGQGDSAFIQGQLVIDSTSNKIRMNNVTEFVKQQSDRKVSFLITQDPRWDLTQPTLTAGDTQVDRLEIKSRSNGSASFPGPQLKFTRLKDSDGDGISDSAESTTFLTNPALADTDGDGLSDGAEALSHNTNPLVADVDGDGFDDGQEILAGTNPNNPSSFFTASVLSLTPGVSARIGWNSLTGRTYQVLRSDDLGQTAWTPVHTVAGNGGSQEFTDTGISGKNSTFYQVKVTYTAP